MESRTMLLFIKGIDEKTTISYLDVCMSVREIYDKDEPRLSYHFRFERFIFDSSFVKPPLS